MRVRKEIRTDAHNSTAPRRPFCLNRPIRKRICNLAPPRSYECPLPRSLQPTLCFTPNSCLIFSRPRTVSLPA